MIAAGLWLALGVWLAPGVGVLVGVGPGVLVGDVAGVDDDEVWADVGVPPPKPRSSQPPATTTIRTAKTMARLNQ